MPIEAGELIAGRYRKLGTIGVGGMARVVLAEDERLRRRVAIKALHADSLDDSAQRFEREARIGASLNHPNLVSVYDVVTDTESVLIVMEYVEGKTLKEAIAEGPLDRATAISVIGGVAGALDHAHKAGIVHRDVKPANILIREDGVAKLADLGIATAAENTRITSSGIVLGTAVYMAPEQLEGERPGPAADIYSLAAVAYEALSGKRARDGTSPVEIAHKAATGPPPDLLEVCPDAPPAAARALARGMCRDPGGRQPSARALAGELARSLTPPPAKRASDADADRTVAMERTVAPERTTTPAVRRTPPPPAGAAPPLRRAASPSGTQRGRRFPSWLPAAAALVLIGVVGAVALASLGGENEDPPPASDRAAERRKPEREQQAPASPQPAPSEQPAEEPQPAPEEPATEGVIDPEEGARLDAEAFGLIKQERYAEAVPIARQAVASFPEDDQSANYAFALFNLGTALNRSGSPDEAIPFLEKRLSFSDDRREVVQAELDDASANAGGG
ncbi:MAG: protein kinase domain-containing protein [Thermoleophilaceae bacterium]